MRRKRKQHTLVAAVLTVVSLVCAPVYASSTTEQIETVQSETEEAQSGLTSVEERLAKLEASKSDSQAFLEELSSQLNELTQSLAVLSEQLTAKEAELEEIEAELEQAREDEQVQYEAMKLRIQYLYEQSLNSGILQALLSADGFMDFINRADAFAQLTEYDREMLQAYTDTITLIQEKEEQLEQEKAQIVALKEEQLEQLEQVQTVYEAAYNELRDIELSIEESEDEKAELVSLITQQGDTLDSLLAQKYQEEAAEKAAAEAAAAEAQAAAIAAANEAASQEQASSSSSSSSSSASNSSTEVVITVDSSSESSSSSSSSSDGLTYLGNFKITGYCGCSICCGSWSSDPPISSSGAVCVEGVTVAMGGVDFGTQLSINGHVYTVQDRGTAYGHVDIYFTNHADALAWGVQYIDVYLVG